MDLLNEALRVGEFLFVAQLLEEFDLHLFAIDILGKIEKMHFQMGFGYLRVK